MFVAARFCSVGHIYIQQIVQIWFLVCKRGLVLPSPDILFTLIKTAKKKQYSRPLAQNLDYPELKIKLICQAVILGTGQWHL